jgi:hypothetical protein
MRKKVQKRRRGKSNVLPLREGIEEPSDTGTPPVNGPGRLGEPIAFTQFPRCKKCSAEGEGTITVAYVREYDVLGCSCVKCGFQWDMVPKDKINE